MLVLLAVVATFRHPTEPMFWAAAAFFAVHTGMAVRRWSRARRVRTTATVTRHHGPRADPPIIPPIVLKTNPRRAFQQTENTL